jgi:sulfite exporter TauE/SafE
MQWPLVLAGLATGVAASPHCAAMCGAPCAAIAGGCARRAWHFHLGRLVGYMAGGAVAASSVAAVGAWSQAAPALRPVWMLLHLAFLALGLWWLAAARQPAWMQRRAGTFPLSRLREKGKGEGRAWHAAAAGLAWIAWPCGALQAALLLAALARDAQGGALVMAAHAVGSTPALVVGPWAWRRWRAWRGAGAAPAEVGAWSYRVAGLGLMLGSGWAVLHGVWERIAAWCAA